MKKQNSLISFFLLVDGGFRVLRQEGPAKTWRRFKNWFLYSTINKFFNPAEVWTELGNRLNPIELSEDEEYIDPSLLNDRYRKVYATVLNSAKNQIEEVYVPLAKDTFPLDQSPVKMVAFYLPQFHPIPENDEWWGKGFTEWANVSKAVPQFVGHHQPHLPGELGYYDLRVPDVQRRQVELARQYGIYGFCFYYYWFHGKRLLEGPLDQFMTDSEIDFPFCICWANENWTRRWDGLENEILISQEHTPENDIAFIRDLVGIFNHKNYIRIDGRPLLIVYQTQILPDPKGTARRWKEYCRSAGIPEPYLVAAQTFKFKDPRLVGFDAAIEFPPHNCIPNNIVQSVELLNPTYQGRIFDYSELVSRFSDFVHKPPYRLFKTVVPSWDNEARKPGRGFSFILGSPSLYKGWLQKAGLFAIQHMAPQERFVFINAWNEWGEGAHLEPDRKYGYAYLQATADGQKALLESDLLKKTKRANAALPFEMNKRHDTAVILHLFYPEMWNEIKVYLSNLNEAFDLYITIPEGVDIKQLDIETDFPFAYTYRCENRGRDIAPFLTIFKAIYPLGYQYVCKIHTKKSSHREDGGNWRHDMLDKLLGSRQVVTEVKKGLKTHPTWGLIAPKGHVVPHTFYWSLNKKNVETLARRAGLPCDNMAFVFSAGSMFWFKPEVFHLLSMLDIQTEDFEPEEGQVDGTLAHAIERFFGILVYQSGYQIMEINDARITQAPNPQAPVEYAHAAMTYDTTVQAT